MLKESKFKTSDYKAYFLADYIELNKETIRITYILEISKILTKELGKGFSRSNLFNMRSLYLKYSSVQSLSGQLSWTHYCELISIEDKHARDFYEKEAINSKWSVRELRRQIDTSLF